jgi:hypothetical protein
MTSSKASGPAIITSQHEGSLDAAAHCADNRDRIQKHELFGEMASIRFSQSYKRELICGSSSFIQIFHHLKRYYAMIKEATTD